MSADFYVKVTVTQVFMDEVFREIVFPNAYMRDFTETINPNTGEGSFGITLLQKIDKVGDIVFQPFDAVFREQEVHYEETLDSVKLMSYSPIDAAVGVLNSISGNKNEEMLLKKIGDYNGIKLEYDNKAKIIKCTLSNGAEMTLYQVSKWDYQNKRPNKNNLFYIEDDKNSPIAIQ